jgi:23S rRNA (guanosine2251-2'-O)-methyltransferase
MSDHEKKRPFQTGRGKPFERTGRRNPKPAWRERERPADGPAILYGWHTVTLALANPKRRIRKLLLTENAARRLDEENIATRITPDIVRPASTRSRQRASCWCSTRSPIRTMSARSSARPPHLP